MTALCTCRIWWHWCDLRRQADTWASRLREQASDGLQQARAFHHERQQDLPGHHALRSRRLPRKSRTRSWTRLCRWASTSSTRRTSMAVMPVGAARRRSSAVGWPPGPACGTRSCWRPRCTTPWGISASPRTSAASPRTRFASTSPTRFGGCRPTMSTSTRCTTSTRRVSAEELWGTYERIVANGEVLYAGSSNYSGWGLASAQMQAWQRGFVGFISEQTQYNLLSRVPEMEVLPAAQEFGIGVIVYMPLGGGSADRQDRVLRRLADSSGRGGVRHRARSRRTLSSETSRRCARRSGNRSMWWPLPGCCSTRRSTPPSSGSVPSSSWTGSIVPPSSTIDDAAMERLNEIFDINKGRKIGAGRSPWAHAW